MRHALTKRLALSIIADEIASLIGHENPTFPSDAQWLIESLPTLLTKKAWNDFFERYLDNTTFFISMFLYTQKNLDKIKAADWFSSEEAKDLHERIEERFCM